MAERLVDVVERMRRTRFLRPVDVECDVVAGRPIVIRVAPAAEPVPQDAPEWLRRPAR